MRIFVPVLLPCGGSGAVVLRHLKYLATLWFNNSCIEYTLTGKRIQMSGNAIYFSFLILHHVFPRKSQFELELVAKFCDYVLQSNSDFSPGVYCIT